MPERERRERTLRTNLEAAVAIAPLDEDDLTAADQRERAAVAQEDREVDSVAPLPFSEC